MKRHFSRAKSYVKGNKNKAKDDKTGKSTKPVEYTKYSTIRMDGISAR